MASKKEEIKKKVAEKVEAKKNAAKKPTAKKQTKKVTKVTEEQLPKIAEEINEPAVIEMVDSEKFKDEKGEYDLTKTTETEVVNGDPAVLDKAEPSKKENVVEKKESKINKITKKISRSFGYLWNGQIIDY